jgi:hypothetical protein
MKALLRMSLTILIVCALFAGLATIAAGPIVAALPLPMPTGPCPRQPQPLSRIGLR